MADINQTLLEMFSHLLKQHPQLAPSFEQLAALAQGKKMEDIIAFSEWALFKGLTTQEVFTKIYAEGHWGRSTDAADRFFSGSGSRHPLIVGAYINAVREFLSGLPQRPRVVDLGCGDFCVGYKIRDLCADYVACDIVAPLIAFNREKYHGLHVDFRTLDLTRDALPEADVVFVRQVLQHLSNAEILAALPELCRKYKYLVLTEHLPAGPTFVPNLDKPTGRDIRLGLGSGIVLTCPPFDLQALAERTLCEVAEGGGTIRTTLYQLA